MNQPSRISQLTDTSLAILQQEGLMAFLRRVALWLRGERRFYRPSHMPDALTGDGVLLQCDAPSLHMLTVVHGVTGIRGWALAAAGVDKIQLYVAGVLVGETRTGELRPDLRKVNQDIANADRGGFSLRWDTTTVPDGEYKFQLLAITKTGRKQTLTGRVAVNNTHPPQSDYELWIDTYEPHDLLEAKTLAGKLPRQIYFSVVMPVYNTEATLLRRAIASVQAQSYPHWELCLADDGSTQPHVRHILEQACSEDERIKVAWLENNAGISAASNAALKMTHGEFVVLMDHDDELAQHAFYFVAKWLNRQPEADLIYSDEDKIDLAGRRYEPFFKPDWSPDLFLSMNYLNHLTVIRANLLKAVGGFCSAYDGSQDYDLYLRLFEKTDRIAHIPKILYHWRAAPTSVAYNVEEKSFATTAARQALSEHLRRKGVAAKVTAGLAPGRWRINYSPSEPPPALAILIPCHTNVEGLSSLTGKIVAQQSHPSLEFVIIDNSAGDEVYQVHQRLLQETASVKYLDWRGRSFNFSQMNNAAVRLTEAPLLLFLNDDVDPITPDWLAAMLEHIQRPEVGVVGAKLRYPDNTIQHAGVVMGLYNNCGHAFKALPAAVQETVYFDLPHVVRNCSAVTGACLLTRQDVFWQVGGFNEIHLPAAFQDIDLCLKIGQQGYRIIYTPHAELYHHESKTKYHTDREISPHPYEVWYMQQTWAAVIANDPYYNPNLTRYAEDFSLRPTMPRYVW